MQNSLLIYSVLSQKWEAASRAETEEQEEAQLREVTGSGIGLTESSVQGLWAGLGPGGGLVHLKWNQVAVVCNLLQSRWGAWMQAFRGTTMDVPRECQESMLGVAKKQPLTE